MFPLPIPANANALMLSCTALFSQHCAPSRPPLPGAAAVCHCFQLPCWPVALAALWATFHPCLLVSLVHLHPCENTGTCRRPQSDVCHCGRRPGGACRAAAGLGPHKLRKQPDAGSFLHAPLAPKAVCPPSERRPDWAALPPNCLVFKLLSAPKGDPGLPLGPFEKHVAARQPDRRDR